MNPGLSTCKVHKGCALAKVIPLQQLQLIVQDHDFTCYFSQQCFALPKKQAHVCQAHLFPSGKNSDIWQVERKGSALQLFPRAPPTWI